MYEETQMLSCKSSPITSPQKFKMNEPEIQKRKLDVLNEQESNLQKFLEEGD